jgi:hypothetical protein
MSARKTIHLLLSIQFLTHSVLLFSLNHWVMQPHICSVTEAFL